jgi:hypothetical protein
MADPYLYPPLADYGPAQKLIDLAEEIVKAQTEAVNSGRPLSEKMRHAFNARVKLAARECFWLVRFGAPVFETWEEKVGAVKSACVDALRSCRDTEERKELCEHLNDGISWLKDVYFAIVSGPNRLAEEIEQQVLARGKTPPRPLIPDFAPLTWYLKYSQYLQLTDPSQSQK